MIKRCLSIFLSTGVLLLLMVFLVPSSPVFASSSQTNPKSGFMKTCNSLSMSGTILTGSCRKANGTLVGSTLNLNPYIGNNDGDLVTGSSGFGKSCFNEYIDYYSGYPFLVATCYDISGFAFVSSISLNDYISNINGSMVWAG